MLQRHSGQTVLLQAQTIFLLLLMSTNSAVVITPRSLRFLLDLSELVAVAQDQVHVFVERFERADEDPAVLEDTAHPEVDVLQHLTALPHRLEDRKELKTTLKIHTLQTNTDTSRE